MGVGLGVCVGLCEGGWEGAEGWEGVKREAAGKSRTRRVQRCTGENVSDL